MALVDRRYNAEPVGLDALLRPMSGRVGVTTQSIANNPVNPLPPVPVTDPLKSKGPGEPLVTKPDPTGRTTAPGNRGRGGDPGIIDPGYREPPPQGRGNTYPSPAGTQPYVDPRGSMYGPPGGGQAGYSGAGAIAGRVSEPNPRAVDVNVDVGPADYEQFQQFSDTAYEQARRYLDPEIERRTNEFNQMLINRGIDPDSEAGREAFTRFNTQLNDMTSRATFDALAEGRGYQQQLWDQGFGEASLENALQRAIIGAGATTDAARTSAAASRYGADIGLEGLLARLGEEGRQFDLNLGQRESEFGRNYGLDRDRFAEGQYQYDRGADLAELLASVGIDLDYADLGLRTDNANWARDRAEMDDFWRWLGALPQQATGSWGANQGAAGATVNSGRGGSNIMDMFSWLFPQGGG